jgi:hypothetical protein
LAQTYLDSGIEALMEDIKITNTTDNTVTSNELGTIAVDWTNIPTLSELKLDMEAAKYSHDNQVTKIDAWLDNLNVTGKAKPEKIEGRSEVQPKLIRKLAEWRYAALSEPFLSTDKLFDIMPRTFEDVDAAKQNKMMLNYQFNNQINKNQFIDEYVRTGVDEGTIIVRVGWEYEEEITTKTIPTFVYEEDDSMVEVFAEIAALKEQNPRGFEETVPYELQQALITFEEERIAYRPTVTGQEEIEDVLVLKNQPTADICKYNNVTIDPSCNGILDKARFIIYSYESSKAELEATGRHSNIDKINIDNNSILGEVDHHSSLPDTSFNFSDEARKKFIVHEYWGFRDVDNTNLVTPILCSWVGNTITQLEQNPYPDQKLPFVTVPYLPVRNSIYGEPDGALLEDNQKLIGAAMRGLVDVLGRSANGQTAMRRDMLDATNKRKYERGDNYEFNMNVDPRQGIYQHVWDDLPTSGQWMIEQQTVDAESLTGVKAFSGGISGEGLGSTATGVRGALDSASQRELGLLRRLATGIIEIGKKFISMNGTFLLDKEVIRITNETFVEIKKEDLVGNFDMKLSISTAEEDNAKVEKLAFMLQTMGPNSDPAITQKIQANLFDLQKLPDLAEEIRNYQPEPDPVQAEIQQLQVEKLRKEIELLDSEIAENYNEAKLDSAKADTETVKANVLQSQVDAAALDFVETESGTKQERELQKATAQAEGNMQLEVLKSGLDEEKEGRALTRDIGTKLLDDYLKNSSNP